MLRPDALARGAFAASLDPYGEARSLQRYRQLSAEPLDGLLTD
jgi:hypothetical protein